MCGKCNDPTHQDIQTAELTADSPASEILLHDRRQWLKTGAALSAGAAGASLLGMSGSAMAAASGSQDGAASVVRAYGATEEKGSIKPMTIERRAVGPQDVMIEILYAGICHSDIHAINGDWGSPALPIVPGHEIVGRVSAVGNNVTRFKKGDIAGVGCMVDSCGACEHCLNNREQICKNGTTFTYGAPDKVSGGHTYGGYSKRIVVKEHFAVNVPKSMDLSRVAPIMCAGITTFSPMNHWDLKKDQKVGVIGIGGLGHMAVKLGIARGAKVTAFTTSPSKVETIKEMGVEEVVLWDDREAMERLNQSFDLMIAAVPTTFEIQPFMNLLKVDSTFVNVGDLGTLGGISGMQLAFMRHRLAGSMIGGMKETQEVVNFCAEHNVLPDVEIIKPSEINNAIARVQDKDVKFRFVIDMQAV